MVIWNIAALSPYATSFTQGFGNFNFAIPTNAIGFWLQEQEAVQRERQGNARNNNDESEDFLTVSALGGDRTFWRVVRPLPPVEDNFAIRPNTVLSPVCITKPTPLPLTT